MRHTSFLLKLRPDAQVKAALRRHAGARRFAYNFCVRAFSDGGEKRREDPTHRGPCTGFDFINVFNGWKRSPEAGVDVDGAVGLPWRGEIYSSVFEEACVDAGRGVTAFFAWCAKKKKQAKKGSKKQST